MAPQLKRGLLPVVLALGGLLAVALLRVPTPGATRQETVRGITISTHTDGSDWASPHLRSTMEDIQSLGADWVCTHPYGWIGPDGSIAFHDLDPDHPPAHITGPIEEAHALGLKILIKPHIGYWGSPFSHRAAIRFEDPEAWDRFFRDYERWIVQLARLCRNADAFVVGTELDGTVEHEVEWRRIIAAVRAVCPAPLTYGANWDGYRSVPFWDALDVIGVQAYFPVASGPEADSASIVSGWERVMGELRGYARDQNRKIAFTELGYNRSLSAATEPWSYRMDGPDAEAFQALCLGVALRAVEQEPEVVAVFLWKWFPNPRPVGRNFQLATPGLRRTIASVWKEPRAAG